MEPGAKRNQLKLAYTLVGIAYRRYPEASFIYMRNDENIISQFSSNEIVYDNWRITEIGAQSVSLQYKNSTINLFLQFSGENLKEPDAHQIKISEVKSRKLDQEFSRKLQNYINGRVLASVPYPYGVESYGIEKIASNEYLIDKHLIQEQLKESNVADHFKFEIDEGLKLTEIVPGSLFDKAGLEPGDKIKLFNNQAINTTGDAFSMTRELIKNNKMHVEFQRNNTAFNYQYHIINAGILED